MLCCVRSRLALFFNDTPTTEIYTLSLHDALPSFEGKAAAALDADVWVYSSPRMLGFHGRPMVSGERKILPLEARGGVKDRKSTRLNSSHANISYAVFCL